jgi:hypothetical protein
LPDRRDLPHELDDHLLHIPEGLDLLGDVRLDDRSELVIRGEVGHDPHDAVFDLDLLDQVGADHIEPTDLIPAQAAISVYYGFVTHLDHRPEIYEFPNPWYLTNWADRKSNGQSLPALAARVTYVLVPEELPNASAVVFDHLVSSGEFRMVYDQAGVVLLERALPSSATGPRLEPLLPTLAGHMFPCLGTNAI